jgi:DUF4097 and DUF4098 domain-containing protein YvlB
MLASLTIAALAALAGVQQTDTIVSLQGATRLALENRGGQVVVTTWDRDAVRIQAEHAERTWIEVERDGDVIEIQAGTRRGPPTVIDYAITVPPSLDLDIEGLQTAVTIEGVAGEVEVETLEGDIHIRGGRGSIIAETTNGEVTIEDAEGVVEMAAVAGGVTVTNSSGEILAETVMGPITIEGVTARIVEAATVSGRILYDGTIEEGGRYSFGAHAGRIELVLPAGVNAEVTAVSLAGEIRADYPGAPTEFAPRKRSSFTLGSGGARIEAETFSGDITMRRR